MRHPSPERILQELLCVLEASCPRIRVDSWSPLARPLFRHLRKLGREYGYDVWDSSGKGGYLWDIVWESPPKAQRHWLELVGEIELSDSGWREILDDFYKVLDAKARLKVFVSAPPSRKLAKTLRKAIDSAVAEQLYRVREERIIAVVLEYYGRLARYLASVRIYDGSGPIKRWRSEWEDVVCGS